MTAFEQYLQALGRTEGPKPFPLLIEQMTVEQIQQLEVRLRVEYNRENFVMGSSLGFLAPGESLKDVIEKDARILRELGLTYAEIANVLARGVSEGRTKGFNQSCPWGDYDPGRNDMLVYEDPNTSLNLVYSFLCHI